MSILLLAFLTVGNLVSAMKVEFKLRGSNTVSPYEVEILAASYIFRTDIRRIAAPTYEGIDMNDIINEKKVEDEFLERPSMLYLYPYRTVDPNLQPLLLLRFNNAILKRLECIFTVFHILKRGQTITEDLRQMICRLDRSSKCGTIGEIIKSLDEMKEEAAKLKSNIENMIQPTDDLVEGTLLVSKNLKSLIRKIKRHST